MDDSILGRVMQFLKQPSGRAVPMSKAGVPMGYAISPSFDPMGDGYDMETARRAGLQPDETGHWPSRDPRTGMLLKGRGHPTWGMTEQGERDAGYEIFQGDGGRFFSRPTRR